MSYKTSNMCPLLFVCFLLISTTTAVSPRKCLLLARPVARRLRADSALFEENCPLSDLLSSSVNLCVWRTTCEGLARNLCIIRLQRSYQRIIIRVCLQPRGAFRLAGYQTANDVSTHAKIDVDQANISTAAFRNGDFEEVEEIYTMGANSMRPDGSFRTIQGFSLNIESKLSGVPIYQLYKNYFASPTYGDNFTTSAIRDIGPFEGFNGRARAQGITKTTAYSIVWMYIVNELNHAKVNCASNPQMASLALDEAWVFYAGSLVGPEGLDRGRLIYSLARGICGNFPRMCDSEGRSKVNKRVLQLYNKAKRIIGQGKCSKLDGIIEKIIVQQTIPPLAAAIRYAYTSDPLGFNRGEDAWAEGWAYLRSSLPQIDRCDAEVADDLVANYDIENEGPMKDGFLAVAQKIQSVFECLGFSCADVGPFVFDGEILIPNC